MAEEERKSATTGGGLEGLAAAARSAGGERKRLPPVHLWNPDFCGDIDMRIAADGTWFYMGTPIGRPALVQLFSTILRKDPERYVLVTPVERVGIKVDDAPFLGVELQRTTNERGQVLRLRTNVEDWVEIDADHPLRFAEGASEGLKPYVLVRGRLEALVKRALLYDLVDWGEVREVDGEDMFGVASAGEFFPMAKAAEVEAWAAQ
ncbi:MAG: DUF1285 domain-containing protein [Methylobacteriaceae bacterium]|nr:DUF1285 domain-containing protein [Methylobacteriaceae bacterium]